MSYTKLLIKRLVLTLLPFLAITALTIVISGGIHTNESGFITMTPPIEDTNTPSNTFFP